MIKRAILMSMLAFSLFQGKAQASLPVSTDAEFAKRVSILLEDRNIKNGMLDESDGILKAVFETDIGDVSVLIDCEAESETIIFLATTPLKVSKSDMVSKCLIVNKINSKLAFAKVYISQDDGVLRAVAWTSTDCMPSSATLGAIVKGLVSYAEKAVQEVSD